MPNAGYWGAAKPPPGTPIDPTHLLAQGLLYCWPCTEGAGTLQNAVNPSTGVGQFNAASGIGGWDATNHGAAIAVTLSVGYITFPTDTVLGLPTGPSTILLGWHKRDASNRASAAFGVDDTTNRIGVHLPYSDGTVYFDYGGASEGSTRLSIGGLTFGDDFWAFTTGPRGMEIWQNSLLRATNSANPTRSNVASPFYLGLGQGMLSADNADAWYFAIYTRQLRVEEIQSVTAQPFQMFAPPVWRRYFIPAAAAVTTVERRTLSPVGARVGSRQAS